MAGDRRHRQHDIWRRRLLDGVAHHQPRTPATIESGYEDGNENLGGSKCFSPRKSVSAAGGTKAGVTTTTIGLRHGARMGDSASAGAAAGGSHVLFAATAPASPPRAEKAIHQAGDQATGRVAPRPPRPPRPQSPHRDSAPSREDQGADRAGGSPCHHPAGATPAQAPVATPESPQQAARPATGEGGVQGLPWADRRAKGILARRNVRSQKGKIVPFAYGSNYRRASNSNRIRAAGLASRLQVNRPAAKGAAQGAVSG